MGIGSLESYLLDVLNLEVYASDLNIHVITGRIPGIDLFHYFSLCYIERISFELLLQSYHMAKCV